MRRQTRCSNIQFWCKPFFHTNHRQNIDRKIWMTIFQDLFFFCLENCRNLMDFDTFRSTQQKKDYRDVSKNHRQTIKCCKKSSTIRIKIFRFRYGRLSIAKSGWTIQKHNKGSVSSSSDRSAVTCILQKNDSTFRDKKNAKE